MGEYAEVSCEGKVKFDSYVLAKKGMRHNEKRRVPYHCRNCGKWHLGSISIRRGRRRKPRVEDLEVMA